MRTWIFRERLDRRSPSKIAGLLTQRELGRNMAVVRRLIYSPMGEYVRRIRHNPRPASALGLGPTHLSFRGPTGPDGVGWYREFFTIELKLRFPTPSKRGRLDACHRQQPSVRQNHVGRTASALASAERRARSAPNSAWSVPPSPRVAAAACFACGFLAGGCCGRPAQFYFRLALEHGLASLRNGPAAVAPDSSDNIPAA